MSDKVQKSRGLGRGLSALMADIAVDADQTAPRRPDLMVPVEHIRPNPDQPRRQFDENALQELAASLREKGVIQPLIVRPDPAQPGHYQIVAGERRWRAAQIAQLHEVPVIRRDYSDLETLEIAIIENVQRADLNPIDEANGYKILMETFGHTQEKVAEALGKSRSHIANLLRLLTLPADVTARVTSGQITAGHARALVGRPDASALAERIATQRLSVRQAEDLARKPPTAGAPPRPKAPREKDADTLAIERDLSAHLGLRVQIEPGPDNMGGKLILSYRDLEQLDHLLRHLSGD